MGQIPSILWEILSILWEICYLIGIFRNHTSPPSITVLESFSGKCFLTTRAQSEKVGQISFRPPNCFLPVRPCIFMSEKNQPWTLNYVNTTAHHAGMVENAGMGTGYGYRVAGTFCTFSVFCQTISRLKDPGKIRYGFLLLKWPNNLSSFKDSFKVCIIRIKQFNLKYAYFRYL